MTETITIPFTWGDFGNHYRNFAMSNELKVLEGLNHDLAQAMSLTEALNKILPSLTEDQYEQVQKTRKIEMKKQGFELKK